jgi:hypothetical protein
MREKQPTPETSEVVVETGLESGNTIQGDVTDADLAAKIIEREDGSGRPQFSSETTLPLAHRAGRSR